MSDFRVHYAEVSPHNITQRLCLNPNYGGKPCTVPGSCIIPLQERPMKPGFFCALERNVELFGFRNPVLVYNTPEGMLLEFGGSRVRVAKKLDVFVPAIIVDYTQQYNASPKVTPENWQIFFLDEPTYFEFTDFGVLTHYSLERNRRHTHDDAGIEWTKDLDDREFLDKEFPWIKEIE